MTSGKMKAMFAYDDAVKAGDLQAAQRILRLLADGRKRFRNDDVDWRAEQYLNKRGFRESYIDSRGYYSAYRIR